MQPLLLTTQLCHFSLKAAIDMHKWMVWQFPNKTLFVEILIFL